MRILTKLFGHKGVPKQSIIEPVKIEEPRHMHTWVLTAQTYAPPSTINLSGGNMDIKDPKTFEKLAFGVTTLLWECEKCTETKKEEMLGSDEETLEELVKKVRLTGPQYIERGGETFVFNKWTPATNIPGNIPIR